MEFLGELNDEKDYDLMSVKLTQGDRIEGVRTLFPRYNTRILLSSFMIRNFNKILDIPDDLVNKSEEIIGFLLGTGVADITIIYPIYFRLFNAWRNDDINKLKDTIEIHKIIYDSMLDEIPDKEWHDGVSNSMNIMDKHIDKLDTYSKTPPKY